MIMGCEGMDSPNSDAALDLLGSCTVAGVREKIHPEIEWRLGLRKGLEIVQVLGQRIKPKWSIIFLI